MRTDPHRPSVMNPADYTWVRSYPPASADPDGSWLFTCEHCGHFPCLWGEEYRHEPTGAEILVGHICAAHYFDFDSRAQAESAKAHRAFMRAREVAKNRSKVVELNPVASEYLEELAMEEAGQGYHRFNGFDFMQDMVRRYRSGLKFSEKQLDAVVRCVERDKERQVRITALKAARATQLQTANAAPTGRVEVEGRIVKTKVHESDFGPTLKMLVELHDGNRCWGTVPRALEDWELRTGEMIHAGDYLEERDLQGRRVRFTATFEISHDDEHFAFFKRPTNAELIQEVTT